MYLNDFQRSDFYKSIGLDPRQYDMQVIRKTNESAARIFPIALNIDKPEFFQYLDKCASYNRLLIEIDKSNQNQSNILKSLRKMPLYIQLGINFIKLYLIPPIDSLTIISTIR